MTNEEWHEGRSLRKEVIALRDEALNQGNMEWGVKLSHVIKWMHDRLNDEMPVANLSTTDNWER